MLNPAMPIGPIRLASVPVCFGRVDSEALTLDDDKPLVSLTFDTKTGADQATDTIKLTVKDDENVNKALTGLANAFKEGVENPRPVGPNTRAVKLVNGAFWQGARAGFWTDVTSWMALHA